MTEEKKELSAEEIEKAKAASKSRGDERDKAGETKEEGEERAKAEVEKAEPIISEEELLKAIDLLEEFNKASDEIEEEDEDDKEEDEEKALQSMEDNDTLEKAIDVSPFLEALVNETSLALDAVGSELSSFQKSMKEFDGKHVEVLKALAAQLKENSETIKGLTSKIEAFEKSTSDRLAVIEATPVTQRKSITKAVDIKKSFVSGDQEGDLSRLSRRQIADALTKAFVAGKVRDTVVMNFEGNSNYQLSQEDQEIVKSFIE